MQDTIAGFLDIVKHIGPLQMTVAMVVLSILVAIPIVRLVSYKTSLIEKVLSCAFMIMVAWFQWWLAGI